MDGIYWKVSELHVPDRLSCDRGTRGRRRVHDTLLYVMSAILDNGLQKLECICHAFMQVNNLKYVSGFPISFDTFGIDIQYSKNEKH